MSWPVIETQSVVLFMLILARTAAFFAVFPGMGGGAVPMRLKAGVAATFSALLFTAVPAPALLPTDPFAQVLLVLRESIVGLLLGSLVNFLFMAAQFGGEIVGVQSGLAAAGIYDPSTQETVGVYGRFYYIVALLLFLSLDLHHPFLRGLGRSFSLLPVGEFGIAPAGFLQWAKLSGQVFTLALRLSMPVIAALLLLDLALGFLSRLVPQMNIFIVGFPLKIVAALAVLALGLRTVGPLLTAAGDRLAVDFHSLLTWMR
ncbi:flagellar biosynthetic protein FliR [bacterium]|nr:flagellar biosynthetic protein FliR [bacterium]